MSRRSRKRSKSQLTFAMATEPTSSSGHPEKDHGFVDSDAASHALAKASEALNDLRDIAAQVDADMEGHSGTEENSAGMEIENRSGEDVSFDEVAAAADQKVEAPVAGLGEPEKLISEVLQQKNVVAPSPPPAKQKVGEMLRDARIAANFALEDVAAEIKIRPHHLEAIEEGRFGDLPSRTYAIGFVRAYAQVLGLDAEAMVQECKREVSHHMPYKAPQMAMPEPVADSPMPSSSLVFMTAAVAFLLSAVGYIFTRDTTTAPVYAPPPSPAIVQSAQSTPKKEEPKPASQVQSAVPVQQPVQQTQPVQPQAVQPAAVQQNAQPPSAVPQGQVPHEEPANVDTADVDTTHVSSGFLQKGLLMPSPQQGAQQAIQGKTAMPSRIKLKAVEETTVQIFDNTGHMIAERVINKGEAFYVPDKSGYTLATTNAGALHMQIDGKEMQPLGDEDEAMHNIPLNPDSLLKYLQ